jgi:CRP-like cAMP-binding protein
MSNITKTPNSGETDLSIFRLFNILNEEELNRLNFDKTCSIYNKGTIIYHEGSRLTGFYCVTGGIIKIYKTGIDGKEQIVRFAQKGDIIAYRSLLSQESACTTARVIDEGVLCHIPYSTLLFLIEKNWKFSLQLLQIVCRELREANEYITDIAQKTVKERLAEVLIILKENFDSDNQNYLKITLTREEIANIVGTATESVIRLLSEFKQEKLIDIKGRKIKLLDMKGLRRIANI